MNDVQAVITLEEAKVSCNFAEVEHAIQERLAEYKGAVFREESKVYAKKHVSSLRAQKKDLQDKLRDEKKRYMEPWEDFEKQAKKLIAMYDEPIDYINGQVQAFEEKRIEEKRQLIKQIYGEVVPVELAGYIPLERIYNKKWENATAKEKNIRDEILEIARKTQSDIDMITSMDSESIEEALSKYNASLDLAAAISYINYYEHHKQKIIAREQERLQQKEEERIRQEERQKMMAKQQAEAEKKAAVEQAKEEAAQAVIDSLIPDEDENNGTDLYEYRILLSADAKKKLEMYMVSVGIEWEMIE